MHDSNVRPPTISVAFDVGPLQSRRTGVGNAVGWTLESLAAQPSVEVHGYMTSMRARRSPTVRRLPLPAAVAQRWWHQASEDRRRKAEIDRRNRAQTLVAQAERRLRDAWGWGIAGGAIDIQKTNIASAMVGRRFDQRR